MDFEPYGYDERQFCSPGFDLPVGRVDAFPERPVSGVPLLGRHLQLIRPDALAESIRAIAALIVVMDENRFLENLLPKGEPRLGKRGLYGGTGGMAPGQFEHAMLWVLSFRTTHTIFST